MKWTKPELWRSSSKKWLTLARIGNTSHLGRSRARKPKPQNLSSDESTMFENHRKSLILHCERSELRLHFEWTKVHEKCQKWSILWSFWKPEACGQTVLPDRSVLIGQKLVENAKIQNFKCDILSNFQTMCLPWHSFYCVSLETFRSFFFLFGLAPTNHCRSHAHN